MAEERPSLNDLHNAEAHNFVGREIVYPLAFKFNRATSNFALLRNQQPRKRLERGGFTRPIRPQQ